MKAMSPMNQRTANFVKSGSDNELVAVPGLRTERYTMNRKRSARGVYCYNVMFLLVSALMPLTAIAESPEREVALQNDSLVQQGSMSSELDIEQAIRTDYQPAANRSRSDSAATPENSHTKSYASGWECDSGFREVNGACKTVKVPENAYPTGATYGRGWACNRGFRKLDEACDAIDMPANAHLGSTGSNWSCERGYRKSGEKCIAVKVPLNGYLNLSRGDGWSCERGYRKIDEACTAIELPTNGYLADSSFSTGWECDRGYRAVDGECAAINVPKNGYLSESSYGPGWRCARGYQATDSACLAVMLPDNAHLDFSGNDWDCNQPYRKRTGKCILP